MRVEGNGSTSYGGIDVETPYEKESSGVAVEDFLQLMVAQLTNQDFMNPVDDTQYVTQLAQFATMQSMQELSAYSQTSYVAGLVGKTVTVASLGIGGDVTKEVGTVSSVNLSGDEYTITVNGKQYDLSQIMGISDGSSTATADVLEAANNQAVYFQNRTQDSISIRWDAPNNSEAEDLVYDVYYTLADSGLDFGDLSGVKKGEKAATGLQDPNFEITGLEAGKNYYVNVVVRNKNGDEAIYQKSNLSTLA